MKDITHQETQELLNNVEGSLILTVQSWPDFNLWSRSVNIEAFLFIDNI